ncbi:MAG: DGQHR domain-containing protein [Nitrosomonadales bacterium]|nr:DGQHR domain-containing protein [Nitrosomonadales bacterium]
MSKISVVLGDKLTGKYDVAQGYITIGDLVSKKEVDTYDPEDRDSGGYQRMVSKQRVKALAKRLLEDDLYVPTSILVNIRKFSNSSLKTIKDNNAELDLAKYKLHVVDGQHRTGAYEEVLENLDEDARKIWEEKLVSIVFLLGVDQDIEREFFHDVNSNAKSIPASYIQELITKMVLVNPSYHVPEKDAWKVEADAVMKILNEKSGIWKNKIKFPGSKVGVIPNSGFVNTLKPLLNDKWFGNMLSGPEEQAEVLMAFWDGIDLHFENSEENPFENTKTFSIQKRIGTAVLHGMLLPVKEYMNEDGLANVNHKGYLDPKTWENYQARFLSLQDYNGNNDLISGVDFWKTGKEGAIGKYSSGAGTKDLITKFEDRLRSQRAE